MAITQSGSRKKNWWFGSKTHAHGQQNTWVMVGEHSTTTTGEMKGGAKREKTSTRCVVHVNGKDHKFPRGEMTREGVDSPG